VAQILREKNERNIYILTDRKIEENRTLFMSDFEDRIRKSEVIIEEK
jgi:hypothetical protein